jgi:thymidine kinase
MGQFFPGSAALFRLAEDIQEVPGGLCWCGKKATMNTRVDPDGNVIREGEQVLIDNQQDIRYMGLCYQHHREGKSHA